ncbi:MAG TPA: NUDIX hydrolase [Flavobacteriaceae bacterium]|nr:NUDIX hydrolase [Flavobacteriaceae bacterium]
MYKVFVKDRPIIVSTEQSLGAPYQTFPLRTTDLKPIIKALNKGRLTHVHLYHKNVEKIEWYLKRKLPFVIAAGGLVKNDRDEVLFIYRNDKWDLPKGHVEADEALEQAAIREVEEETGVRDLKISQFLKTTYHVFKRNGTYKLKVTYWYEMTTDYAGPLKPQKKEGIKKAKWKTFKQSKKALRKSYENIKLVFPEHYLTEEANHGVA